ncbi:MAG: rhodanese-like domain-containing protein [Candidatus Obscuribacter sp.]|nr:rhodanese-like domain-containing protein [Candidatus Obscuribacter sp.]
MATETLTKEAAKAIEYFEAKLAFEMGPFGLKDAIDKKEAITIVDLRTRELFAKSHVPGAINLSYEELEKSTEKLSKDKVTVFYCYGITCHLSAKAAVLAAKKGFVVKELYGGFDEYVNYELPLEGTHTKSTCGTSSCG